MVFLRFVEKVEKGFEGSLNYQAFQSELAKDLDELGCEILRYALECRDERLREEPTERAGWVVARRGDRKTLLTPFGNLEYERTYFKHKPSGRFAYLVDREAGITPHQRIDTGLKGALIE